MRIRTLLIALALIFTTEIIFILINTSGSMETAQDAVLINEALHTVQNDWDTIEHHQNKTGLDYVVLDAEGAVLFQTKEGLSQSMNQAVTHRDTILDITIENHSAGKMIIYNNSAELLQSRLRKIVIFISGAIIVQGIICAWYLIYLNHAVIKPFHKLQQFARRIAGGSLDVPLDMDRKNLFGAFTESFDIMRTELKKARLAEAEANAAKKELIAKLSHDLKTPVASIKAAAEVGAARTGDEKNRDNYMQIMHKADQINTLITNLFTATLEELSELPVNPVDTVSGEIKALLEGSDYLHRASIPDVPDCLIYADMLRLQQVFDNIFANSYKYAGTRISVSIRIDSCRLNVMIEDFGGGVPEEELSCLKEKFRRGSNAAYIEGAGLGLSISDYLMREMHGALILENSLHGLRVTVAIPLSNAI